MVQRYPQPADCAAWVNAQVEQEMAILQSIAKASRSSRATLGLTTKRVPVFVSCGTAELHCIVSSCVPDLTTIAFAQSITPLDRTKSEQPPEGCMSSPITPDLSIHIPLQGLVDLSAEIIKMEKQQRTLQAQVNSLTATINAPGYAERTKPETRAEHTAKLEQAQKQLSEVTASIASFVALLTPEQKKQYQTNKLEALKADLAKLEKDVYKNLPKDVAVGTKLSKKATQAVESALPSMRNIEESIAALCRDLGLPVPDSLPSAKLSEILAASNAQAAAAAASS